MKKESMGAYVGGAYNSVHDVRRMVVMVCDGMPRFSVSGKNWCMWCLAYEARTHLLKLNDDPDGSITESKIRGTIERFERNNPEKAREIRKRVAANLLFELRRDEPKDKYVENVMARARLTLVTRKDGTQYIRLK